MPPKRRRRFQGLYYHSSPPKVMPMNGQAADQNGRKRRDVDNVKLSTIRIWMHEKDIGKLTRVLWAGQGNRLCQQASNNARVKRFLGAVPQVMNAIKELHQAVIDNNLETLQVKLEPPVPPALVTSKDANGLNIIHKAAGLGHTKILEYLVGIWPEGAHETDVTGKTALHWAASAKNNMRCYTLLTKAGCDEEVLDYKMKTPSYYRHKPHEIERAFLVYVPEAPRVSPSSVTDWEALSDDNDASSSSGDVKKLDIKIPAHVNGINERALEDSIENTSELDTNDGTSDDLSKTEATAHELDTPEATEDVGIESENENIARAVSADKTNDEALSETANVDNEEAAENVGNGFDNEAHVLEQEQTAEELLNDEMPIELEEEQNGDMTNEMQEQNGDMANEVEASVTEKTEAEFEQVIEEQEAAIESAKDEIVEHETAVEQAETEEITANGEPELSEPEQEVDEEQEEVQIEDTAATDETQKAAANKQVDVDEEEDDDEDVIAPPKSVQPPQQQQQPSLDLSQDKQEHETDGAESPTSSLAIEGFVQGASEDFTVQSQTAAYELDEDTRIQQIITTGDMEQLAEIVLNGEGARLEGLKTTEPEIQAFLNNVPSYMEKIRRVHDAAREGSLLSLQQALDRRKFAIAKDDISPNGATPLHVAILFGHSDIVRYLAARFPETTEATDNDGRTALHYAATIKDNGHFYNLLTQLGANPSALDKLGHTPEFYLDEEKAKDILTYSELLNMYGAEELENQLLSDQGQAEHVSFQSNPIFKTEQGKYLADSLADPLIKALTEIANKRPQDPVAYLTGYLQNFIYERKPTTATKSGNNRKIHPMALTNSKATPQSQQLARLTSAADPNAIEEDAESFADEDTALAQHMEERDEHGQSMLHFACARSHRRGALYTLIEESRIDVTYRDELYRTARDVALQANQATNAAEIDRYLMAQAVIGDVKPFEHLSLQGYDHVMDIEDEDGKSIIDVAAERQNEALVDFLRNLRSLEETREELHQMIRDNNMERIREITAASNAKWFIKAKNYYGRTALHIAVLKESEEIVQHLVKICPESLKVTDNLERTVLHYAMGTNALESITRILIQNGAKRTSKDLKGRQPSYYFMNKADILRLQEEEEESR